MIVVFCWSVERKQKVKAWGLQKQKNKNQYFYQNEQRVVVKSRSIKDQKASGYLSLDSFRWSFGGIGEILQRKK